MPLNNSPNAQKNLQNLRNYLNNGGGLSTLNKQKLRTFLNKFSKINNKGILLQNISNRGAGPGNRSKLGALNINKSYPNMNKKNKRGLFRFF